MMALKRTQTFPSPEPTTHIGKNWLETWARDESLGVGLALGVAVGTALGVSVVFALTRSTSASGIIIPPQSPFRVGRIQRAVKRSFIANPGCPLTTGQLLKRAYPRQQRYQHWQYAQVRLSSERFAQRVGVARNQRGKPVLWAPKPAEPKLIEGGEYRARE